MARITLCENIPAFPNFGENQAKIANTLHEELHTFLHESREKLAKKKKRRTSNVLCQIYFFNQFYGFLRKLRKEREVSDRIATPCCYDNVER